MRCKIPFLSAVKSYNQPFSPVSGSQLSPEALGSSPFAAVDKLQLGRISLNLQNLAVELNACGSSSPLFEEVQVSNFENTENRARPSSQILGHPQFRTTTDFSNNSRYPLNQAQYASNRNSSYCYETTNIHDINHNLSNYDRKNSC